MLKLSLLLLSFIASSPATSGKPLVIVKKLNDITIIGINRPEKKNCVNHATAKKLMEAFAEFEADRTAKVTFLHSADSEDNFIEITLFRWQFFMGTEEHFVLVTI